ncbi:MAG: serine/threonine-protein phosphatase [Chitinophagaceae bacterium]|nr:serine/threonine-protein phosphatase [Chitinophagaceae bacterium]MCW5929153.1 serine/threonine-protein phosphatase [Chitinophagaceae bacterium]
MFFRKKKTYHTTTQNLTQTYGYKVYSFSETGPSRQNNEDAVIHFQPGDYSSHTLFAMVADGMGGHNAGEVASNLACTTARSVIEKEFTNNNAVGMLEQMFTRMHTAIREAADGDLLLQGMGTTATAIFIKHNHLHFGHVGDSRLYRFSGGELRQLTTDQTLMNKMIKEGKLKPGDPSAGEIKHILLQALGTVATLHPEISKQYFVQKEDYYLLCSDGLYDVLSDREIASLLSMYHPELALECIKGLCYRRMGSDNFSVILVEITDRQVKTDFVTKEQNVML